MLSLPRILTPFALATLLFGGGCASASKSAPRATWNETQSGFSKEELADLLAQFEDTYEAAIREAADRILTLQPDRRTRRLTLLWQARLVPMMRDALDQEDPVYGMLDAWALCLRAQHFFDSGDGGEMFGDNHPIAVEAAGRSLESVEQIAARILAPDKLGRARDAVDELACRYPLRGEFSGSIVRTAVQKTEKDPDIVASIMAAPMAPFRVFEGVDRGASAIQAFAAVSARMTDTVHDFPESLRLQALLLIMELEDLETTQAALAGLEEISQSSARISAVAEQLPEDLRREITLAADDLESRQAQLQQTLRDARDVTDRVNGALERVETAAASVERTATHATSAGDAWTRTFQTLAEMVASIQQPGAVTSSPAAAPAVAAPAAEKPASESPATQDSDSGGFDVNEYTQAAQALDQAAARLQELTREIRELAGSNELGSSLLNLETRAQLVVDASRSSALDVVDRGAWRGAQIVLLFFLGLIGYTLLVRILPPRGKPRVSRES
jgi:hypothetical protein